MKIEYSNTSLFPQAPPSLSASTPASAAASSTAGLAKVRDPSELPVSQRMSQMQEKLAKRCQDEPTAYSVNARMSAWEDMTSANKVFSVALLLGALTEKTLSFFSLSNLSFSHSYPFLIVHQII